MGTGLHEWPLMLFTVIGQSVVGALWVLGMVLICRPTEEGQRTAIHRAMFFLWLLMGLGFIASMMHLGSPMRAFNSLSKIGSSAMSNEIAFGATFFAVGGIYWLLAVCNKLPAGLAKVWLAVAMLLGACFVYAMAKVYMISTVPTWNNGYTYLNFAMTVLIVGPLLGGLLLIMAGYTAICCQRRLAVIAVCALIVSIVANLMQSHDLAMTYSTVQHAAALVPSYGGLLAARVVLIVLGLACWLCPLLRGKNASLPTMIVGFLLVFVGELIGRGIFYGLHMTVGVTYGA